MVKKDTMLRFWCQKVLPLVYDDSLSYYELLNKVVLHLNQHTEDINALIDFYDTFTEDVEEIIRQMMDDGEFNEIVADTIGSLIAEEYDPENQYIIFDYCIYNSKLYRANGSTTGEFDPEKWDERNVAYDLTTIQNYIYSLGAGNVAYDPTATYESGTVGDKLKNLTANDVSYSPSATYDDGTVGKELRKLYGSFIKAKNITSISNLDSESCFFTANADITLSPTSIVVPIYSKGIFVTTGNDAILMAVNSTGETITAYRNGQNWVNPKNLNALIAAEETARINADNTIISEFAINGITPLTDILTCTLLHCEGTVVQFPSGKIVDNKLYVCGRMRITITERTGTNPGITCTLPNGLRIDGTFGTQIGPCEYTDGPRYGDCTQMTGNDGDSSFTIVASESYSNVAVGKTLVLLIPPIVIKLK